MIPKYACKKCGSIDVDTRVWVNINTQKLLELFDEYHPVYFCNQCKEVTKIISLK